MKLIAGDPKAYQIVEYPLSIVRCAFEVTFCIRIVVFYHFFYKSPFSRDQLTYSKGPSHQNNREHFEFGRSDIVSLEIS